MRGLFANRNGDGVMMAWKLLVTLGLMGLILHLLVMSQSIVQGQLWDYLTAITDDGADVNPCQSRVTIIEETVPNNSTATADIWPVAPPVVAASSVGAPPRPTTTTVSSSSTSNGQRLPKLPIIAKPDPFPPLDLVVEAIQRPGNATVLAAQFMLDVAVVGFAKCGTSTMMSWLGKHPEISIPQYEVTSLKRKEPADLVKELYRETGTDPSLLRGYKSPSDITDPRAIRFLKEFFPQTKIIIGIRHPIRMIESFYNHQIQNQFNIRSFKLMAYGNVKGSQGVHYSRAEYHIHLSNLGLTDLATNKTEQSLFPMRKIRSWEKGDNFPAPAAPNSVFLYDTAQLDDTNATRFAGFLEDLQNFLGLTEPLVLVSSPHHSSPGKTHESEEVQREIDAKKIDICESRYKKQRSQLKKIGANAKTWILDYFLASPNVYVSNRDHFRSIVSQYSENPCSSSSSEGGGENGTMMSPATGSSSWYW